VFCSVHDKRKIVDTKSTLLHADLGVLGCMHDFYP
jgi:hypothetical protein